MNRKQRFLRQFANWILPAVAFISIVCVAFLEPRFLSIQNLGNVLGQSAPLMIFALAQMIPIITRGLDLSQGGVVVSTSVIFALLSAAVGTEFAAFISTLVGLSAGLLSGALIATFRVSPFVVTLGVGSLYSGLALILANGQPVFAVSIDFRSIFYGSTLGIPNPSLAVILVALSIAALLKHTNLGRYLFAIGSNEEAAVLAGVPVRLTQVFAYLVCGGLTSIGSVMLSSRIASGHPTSGADIALTAVAAAVIGGVSLFGGRGTVIGVLLGALFLGLLSNALNLINVSSFSQYVAVGLAIIAAVIVDRLTFGRR